jgi:hypothetical protein
LHAPHTLLLCCAKQAVDQRVAIPEFPAARRDPQQVQGSSRFCSSKLPLQQAGERETHQFTITLEADVYERLRAFDGQLEPLAEKPTARTPGMRLVDDDHPLQIAVA